MGFEMQECCAFTTHTLHKDIFYIGIKKENEQTCLCLCDQESHVPQLYRAAVS